MRAPLGFVLVLLVVAACGGDKDGQGTPVDASPGTPGAVTFRLSYDSNVPDSIFVQSGTELGGQGWLTVRPVGGTDLPILDDCGQCNCDSCNPCAVCGAAIPEVTEIPRGSHLDWIWDTSVFRAGTCPTGPHSCERADPLAPGMYLARFCWSFTSDGVGPGHHVGMVTCSDEPFAWPPATTQPLVVEHALCACG